MLPSLPLACQTSALLVSYAPEVERVNGIAPLSRPWHGRILLLNHTRKTGVPSRTLTSNLEFRTLPLCALSYGDGKVFRTTRIYRYGWLVRFRFRRVRKNVPSCCL